MDHLFLIWAVATLPNFGVAMAILGVCGLVFSLANYMASHEYNGVNKSMQSISKITAPIFAAVSICATFLISNPSRAAEAIEATIADGVAITTAHGQAITNTYTKRMKSSVKKRTMRAIINIVGV